MAAPQSTALPDAPQRNESEDEFVSKANAFVAALEPFRQELQTQADFVNDQSEFIDETVNDNLTAINTVSDNIGDVNTVSGNIADVGTVADNVSDVNTVAGIESDVQTVAGISYDVVDLAVVASDIPAAVANAANIADAASLSRRQAMYARSVAKHSPSIPETMRLDYSSHIYGFGNAEDGVINDIQDADTAVSFSRTSAKMVADATGRLHEFAPGEIAYSVDTETMHQFAVIEGQATNLIAWSENLSNAAWVKSRISATSYSIESPTDSIGAYKIEEDSDTGVHRLTYQVSAPSEKLTLSFYIKPDERDKFSARIYDAAGGSTIASAVFDMSSESATASIGRAYINEKLTNGWFRVSISSDAEATGGTVSAWIELINDAGESSYFGDTGSGLYVFGGQLENSCCVTSYIQTYGSQATRDDDSIYRTLGSEYAEGSCTFVFNIDSYDISEQSTTANYLVATDGRYLEVRLNNTNGVVVNVGGSVMALPISTVDIESGKIGVTIEAGERVSVAHNGAIVGTYSGNVDAIPAGSDVYFDGSRPTAGTIRSTIRRTIDVMAPISVSDAFLAEITA